MAMPVVSLICVPKAAGAGDPMSEIKQVTALKEQEANGFCRDNPSSVKGWPP